MPRYSYSPSLSPKSNRHSGSHSHHRSLSTDSRYHRRRSPSPTNSDNGKDLLKTSMVFLGVVGAASIAASKFWPKGILYGEKESWAREAKEGLDAQERERVSHGYRSYPTCGKDLAEYLCAGKERLSSARLSISETFTDTRVDSMQIRL